MKRYRITNKVRFTAFMVTLLLIAGTLVGILTGTDNAQGSSFDDFEEVMVVPGDTVWSIAASRVPEDMDVRDYVHAICTMNDISSGELKAGEEIKVPLI